MLHWGLWWRPLSLLFKSKLPDISFNILCTGYDLRLRMRRFFIQQAQARRWWIGSLKFAIGLEPPSLRNTAGGLYNFFPVSSFALVLLDRSPWSASFFTPRLLGSLRKIFFRMSICSRWDFVEEPFGKWLRLEFLSPYLRLFSFCDYTIPQP